MAGHPLFIANYISMRYKFGFLEPEGEEDGTACDEARGHLRVRYFAVGIDGETITDTVARSVHLFADCSQSSLKAAIKQMEPFPLEFIMRPEDAERIREGMSASVHHLLLYSGGAPGMKRPVMEVTIEIRQMEVDERRHRTLVGDYVLDELDGVTRGNLRMGLTMKRVAGSGGGDYNGCAICMDERWR